MGRRSVAENQMLCLQGRACSRPSSDGSKLKPAGAITTTVAACTSFSCVQGLRHLRNVLANLICFHIQMADKKELDDLNLELTQVQCHLSLKVSLGMKTFISLGAQIRLPHTLNIFLDYFSIQT